MDTPDRPWTSAAAARKRLGRHYTPSRLADFLAGEIVNELPDRARLRILDPACGDGELLAALVLALSVRSPVPRMEVVGYDVDPTAVAAASARLADCGHPVTLHAGDFLAADPVTGADKARFDAVITNPPYVRTQHLDTAPRRRLMRQLGLSGRVDLTHLFVALTPRLLTPGGVLGLLCSNRFLSTTAGVNVRRVLRDDLRVCTVIDLGDTRPFDAAVLPAVVVARAPDEHDGDATPARFVSAYRVDDTRVEAPAGEPDLLTALSGGDTLALADDGRRVRIRVGVLAPVTDDAPWRLDHPSTEVWLAAVRRGTWRTFGELGRVRVGIKTTADRVFIAEEWASDGPDAALLSPLITHRDLTAWSVMEPATRVLYPYDRTATRRTVVDLDRYPATRRYLERHEQRLRSRTYVTAGGREWFEIWVPQRPHLWAAPKIVFPDISDTPRFAWDRSGAVVNGDCYWISTADLDDDVALLMLAVANSSVGLRFYDEVCGNRLYSGRRRWITQYVRLLPVPDPTTPRSRAVIRLARMRCETGGGPGPDAELDAAVAAAFEVTA
ncbi:Eco57I restriction-modification methylase domain-containing protein [Williamsia sterculiae]|nr:N-6 DNA methylase [Williamsia sterculiae]